MSALSPFRFVYITAPDETSASRIGRALVTERLAACANVLRSASSIYWWQGSVEEDFEAILIVKTRADRMPALTERVKELHPFSVPCIIALPIAENEGNAEFLSWIADEARPG